MFDAVAGERAEAGRASPQQGNGADHRGALPVLVVLHGERSSAGHVGRWLARHGHPLDVRKPRFGDALPKTLARHAGAVIFGGAESANDPDAFIKTEIDWVGVALAEAKPFLGVCLGAQMLAKHAGARVDYHEHGHVEIGYHPLRPTAAGRDLAARTVPWPEQVYHWHREGFELPRGGTLLAAADGAFPNQAFMLGPAAVGVQFHPEIDYSLVLRWAGSNPMRLHMRGAKSRRAQIDDHFTRAPHVQAWLDGFMPRWLDGTLLAPDEQGADAITPAALERS
jgi:GMP synthase (glutamine-hydrolysing)